MAEIVISELVVRDHLTPIHLKAILDVFASSSQAGQIRAALDLLTMAAIADPTLIASNIGVVLSRGFELAPSDAALVRSSCIAVQRVANADLVAGDDRRRAVPGAVLQLIFQQLRLVLSGQSGAGRRWFAAAGQAMDAAFQLHPAPDQFVSSIIRQFVERVFQPPATSVDSTHLAQLFFLVGHGAMRALVYNEHLEMLWKKQFAAAKASPSSAVAANGAGERADLNEEDDDELAVVGGDASDELEVEQLKDRAQNLLADQGGSLIGAMAPTIIAVVANPSQFPDEVRAPSFVVSADDRRIFRTCRCRRRWHSARSCARHRRSATSICSCCSRS